MRVRFSADTNHHYFINMFVISANFHCLELFIAISPLYNAWVLRPQLPIKQWRTGSDWSVCTYCKMNKLLKNGGGAIGPSWHINWWVLRVWVGSLVSGRRDSQLYCLFPHGRAVSEAEWCNDDGTRWLTQGVVRFRAYPSPCHSPARCGEIKVLLLSSVLRTSEKSSFYFLT